LERYDV